MISYVQVRNGTQIIDSTNPTRTPADHETALAEIESLWDAAPGTPDADRLDVLMTLVEAYEEEHYPIPPPDPIDLLLHVMDARGQ